MINIYTEFSETIAAMPVVAGRKSRIESFAGADCTYTIEAMMGDGKALQAGTSHNLGQNFAKAFGIKFQTETGGQEMVYQTSWGVSTRMVGGVIMAHGDDTGLRWPPRLAPTQAGRCSLRARGRGRGVWVIRLGLGLTSLASRWW